MMWAAGPFFFFPSPVPRRSAHSVRPRFLAPPLRSMFSSTKSNNGLVQILPRFYGGPNFFYWSVRLTASAPPLTVVPVHAARTRGAPFPVARHRSPEVFSKLRPSRFCSDTFTRRYTCGCSLQVFSPPLFFSSRLCAIRSPVFFLRPINVAANPDSFSSSSCAIPPSAPTLRSAVRIPRARAFFLLPFSLGMDFRKRPCRTPWRALIPIGTSC